MSSRSEQVLSKEVYPEPKTKAGVPALVREILEAPGPVQKIVLEVGQPVKAWRMVESSDMLEQAPTLDSALLNAEIIEHDPPGEKKTAAERLLEMSGVLDVERMEPVCWATGLDSEGLLGKWLGIETGRKRRKLFGLPLERLKSLPEDTLLLCGAEHSNAEYGEVSVAIKTAIDVRGAYGEEVAKQNVARGRSPAKKRSRGAPKTPADSRGVSGAAWTPPNFVRRRLGEESVRRQSSVRLGVGRRDDSDG